MRAFILAGGMGIRLRPLTDHRPKPLLPFANVPLAKHTVRMLQEQGIDEFVFLLHHRPDDFPKLLGDGETLGCRIQYVSISENLGTAGCVKYVENEITDPALIFSADLIADLNLKAMLQSHRQRKAQITLAIRPEPSPRAFGVVQADSRGRIIRFHEKPTQAELFSNWISCGIYFVEPGFLKNFPGDQPLSFEREVFPFFAENRKPIYGFPLAGYWRDIGTPSSYLQAHEDFLDGKLPRIYYQTAQQHISANRNLLGARIRIDSSCHIEGSFIGDGCIIEKNADVRHSVIWDDVRIGSEAKLENCIIANGARINSSANLIEKSVTATTLEIPAPARAEQGLLTGASKLDREYYPPAVVQAA